MGEIRIEGQGPFHFPDVPDRKVKKVNKVNPARPDEDILHKPKDGIHKTELSGDQLDISQEAVDFFETENQTEE
ncbi:hypothetical protein JXA59_02430 [Patescibacteria group bacterium]|nr:hypothetical protein [Patescibacteria group bacterium]